MLQACSSIQNYGVHAVVANILETRKDKVFIIGQNLEVSTITRREEDGFIENDIVEAIVNAHQRYCGTSRAQS